MAQRMKSHRFILVLSGIAEIEPDVADALYESTGGDIEFNVRDGVAWLEFDRPARSLRQAITTAIKQVESTNLGIRVVRVESEDANTIARINAELLGVGAAR
jgi:hypothetical protein